MADDEACHQPRANNVFYTSKIYRLSILQNHHLQTHRNHSLWVTRIGEMMRGVIEIEDHLHRILTDTKAGDDAHEHLSLEVEDIEDRRRDAVSTPTRMLVIAGC